MRNRKPEKKASLLTPVVFCLATSAFGGELGLWQSTSEPLNERQDAEVAVSPDSASASPSIARVDETLHVFAGKSLVINSPQPLKRVSVTDPGVVSATIITPTQLLIHGLVPGSVSLILWDEQERMRPYELRVEIDVRLVRETMQAILSTEDVEASQSGDSVVLTGTVSSQAVAEQAVALAQTYAENVVNLLEETATQVSLQVRFAEVDRTAVQKLGINFVGALAFNGSEAITTVGTQQFQSTTASVGALPADVTGGGGAGGTNVVTTGVRNFQEFAPAVFGLSDLANIFLFLPNRNMAFVVNALEQRNMLEILAEPNLLALNGREASFLAGGEFPFPVVQGVGGGNTAISIQFREFGVRLTFTPTITPDGSISLKVLQEVSALDFANALTVSGFVVPALSTRRAETELRLRNGQSFAIAGLIDNRLVEVASKIPGLGDIPILGKLFQSRELQRNNSELLVLVTPRIVEPLAADEIPAGVEFPKSFLDTDEFDGKKKEEKGGEEGEEPPPEGSVEQPPDAAPPEAAPPEAAPPDAAPPDAAPPDADDPKTPKPPSEPL